MVVLGVCLFVVLGGVLSSKKDAEWSAAQDLLAQSAAPGPSPKPDSLLPAVLPRGTSASSGLEADMTAAKSYQGGNLFAMMGYTDETSERRRTMMDVIGPGYCGGSSRTVLIPEMVVQEPQGAQFFLDGELIPGEQNGFCEVWRVSGDSTQRKVMRFILCEGSSSSPQEQRHQSGITVELPGLSNMPVAFMNTQFATGGQGHVHAAARSQHITIFDTFSGSLDFKNPFCVAEREPRGVTLRNIAGQVICCISSGGYNTDFANIVDGDGRLMGTVSSRGHGLSGLGLVSGEWKKNRRTLQLGHGADTALMVCAVICAAKLKS